MKIKDFIKYIISFDNINDIQIIVKYNMKKDILQLSNIFKMYINNKKTNMDFIKISYDIKENQSYQKHLMITV